LVELAVDLAFVWLGLDRLVLGALLFARRGLGLVERVVGALEACSSLLPHPVERAVRRSARPRNGSGAVDRARSRANALVAEWR